MRRYFTTIIIANVVSSCLHSYSGFDPCVGGQPLRSAVIPWNIISPPTCYCLLSLFPHLCFGKRKKKKKKKAVPRNYIWNKMHDRRGLVQPKNHIKARTISKQSQPTQIFRIF